MAKLELTIIFFILFCFPATISCQKEVQRNIITINPSTLIKPFEKDWASKKVSQQWIEVKKDKNGYLIYQPCDGNSFFIDWRTQPDIIEIRYQIEPRFIRYDIREEINSNNKFFVNFLKDKATVLKIKATSYDLKNQIALFQIDNLSYLMTPAENRSSFRKIENKCTNTKISELEFLPID